MMKYLTLVYCGLTLALSPNTIFSQTSPVKPPAPVSGKPVMNGSQHGIGRFASPSLTGAVMGLATVDNDANPDLFLQGDSRKPGTYLYYFRKFTDKGEPVFSKEIKLKTPFDDKEEEKRGQIFQNSKQEVYGIWRDSRFVSIARFDRSSYSFGAVKTIKVNNLPRGYAALGLVQTVDGQYLFLFTIQKPSLSAEPKNKNPDTRAFTDQGFWQEELPRFGIYGAITEDLHTTTELDASSLTSLDEAYFSFSGYTAYRDKKELYIIAGTRFGNIHVYQPEAEGVFSAKRHIVDTAGNIMRNPTVNCFPGYFKGSDSHEGLITSGEGGIFYYANTKQKDKDGNLIFENPKDLQQENPELNAGSLVVPDLVDWDGDGVTDMIAGNSVGQILFVKNTGSNSIPAFQSPIALKANGKEIHIQPGYREDIQGPAEARWGYTCPTAIDWDLDGLPDILTGDSRGKFMLFLNIGTKTNPVLDAEHTLYLDGMDLYGGWRSRPGAAMLDGKMAYVITDRDNDFHLYWQIDRYNLTEGFKLTLNDGPVIKAHRRKGGQVGRAKIHMVDWDGDGVKDLLIGTGRGASIPNPINGLPYNRTVKNEGAAVLFLRNSGTDAKPVYEFPKMMKFKGKDILLGAHECAPTTAKIGGDGKTLNLVVGTEYGNMIFYDRKDLSW